jgi:hypothetical protein
MRKDGFADLDALYRDACRGHPKVYEDVQRKDGQKEERAQEAERLAGAADDGALGHAGPQPGRGNGGRKTFGFWRCLPHASPADRYLLKPATAAQNWAKQFPITELAKLAEEVKNFARRQGLHPGIIVGMLQHERVLDWSQLKSTTSGEVFKLDINLYSVSHVHGGDHDPTA